MLYAASQVNPDDVLKLENQQGETIFDDSGDISEDEEEESDEQADSTGAVDEQVGSDDTDDGDEKENSSGMETKQTDTNRAPGSNTYIHSNKKVKVITKPRGAEYKLIRQVLDFSLKELCHDILRHFCEVQNHLQIEELSLKIIAY